jgi:hypothetical protein
MIQWLKIDSGEVGNIVAYRIDYIGDKVIYTDAVWCQEFAGVTGMIVSRLGADVKVSGNVVVSSNTPWSFLIGCFRRRRHAIHIIERPRYYINRIIDKFFIHEMMLECYLCEQHKMTIRLLSNHDQLVQFIFLDKLLLDDIFRALSKCSYEKSPFKDINEYLSAYRQSPSITLEEVAQFLGVDVEKLKLEMRK